MVRLLVVGCVALCGILLLLCAVAPAAGIAPFSKEDIIDVIKNRDYETLSLVLHTSVSTLNGRPNEYTPLHAAVLIGDPISTAMLLKAGANPVAMWETREGEKCSPLTLALEKRQTLAANSASLKPLITDSCNYHVVADMLIDWCTANPKYKDVYFHQSNKFGQDPIELAAGTRDLYLFKKLLNLEMHRYDVGFKNDKFRNWTILHYLSDVEPIVKNMAENVLKFHNNKSEMKAMKRIWNVTIPGDALAPDMRSYNRTSLLSGISKWNLKFVKTLMNIPGASHVYHLNLLNAKDLIGQTPLHLASDAGDIQLLRYYLDKIMPPSDWQVPSIEALNYITNILISPTLDFAHTALHVASYKGHADAVEVWCDAIARYKRLATDFSRRMGRQLSVVSFYGLLDGYRRTPLDVALDEKTYTTLRTCMGLNPDSSPLPSNKKFYTPSMASPQNRTMITDVNLDPLSTISSSVNADTSNVQVFKTGASGWGETIASQWDINVCDIDRREGLSVDEFYRDYFSVKKPVVLVGAAENWPAYHKWTRENFTKNYGEVEFAYGRIPYSHMYGNTDSGFITANSYVAQMMKENDDRPMYLFDNKVVSKIPELAKDCNNSEYFDGLVYYPMQFMLGPAHSGSNIHYHTNAWCNIIHGRKRWFMFPPSQTFLSVTPINEWVRNEYVQLENRPLECYQNPGDIVYVPESWAHGVLNIHNTIAVSLEIMRYYSLT
eukprot:TRINITY_DN8133_c0_g1_i1.p1 TRINITY_DN8133_c0_g1~~TRINITY_DN8133_c0_g1_i1.p1  ORF type:complete len:728 (-),score=80.98 TRINITY_DN8133_c0_g1_i1:28-2187(-)